MSKSEVLASGLERLGIAQVARSLHRRHLLVLTYHRVREAGSEKQFLFDDETFSCDSDQFDKQIRWLSENRRIVSLDEVVEAVRGSRRVPDHSTLITFDDGAIDNYDVAYPILRKHEATAVFFIPTLMLTERQTGWWDNLAHILKTAPPGAGHVTLFGRSIPVSLATPDAVRRSIQLIQGHIKAQSEVDYTDFLGAIAAATGGRMPSRDVQSTQMVTEEHLRDMRSGGMSIGAHSHSHRILSQITEREQRIELQDSKSILEEILGERVLGMAYPVGGEGHYTVTTCELAREAGYECAFNFRQPGGFADLRKVNAFDIPRVGTTSTAGAIFRAQCSGIDPATLRSWLT